MAENGIVELTDASFKEEISKGVVLVDFWATWCAPCQMQGPILETVAENIGDKAVIAKLDVDKEGKVAADSAVQSIPTLIIYKDGQEVIRFVGVQQENVLLEELNKAIVG